MRCARGGGRFRALRRHGLRLSARDYGLYFFRCHPHPVRQLMAEPGALPFGVAAGIALAAFGRLLERDLAVEMANEPWHAMRLHGRKSWIEATRRERTHLIERARGQHRIKTHINAPVELLALDLQKDLDRGGCVDRRLHALTVPVTERAPGRQQH